MTKIPAAQISQLQDEFESAYPQEVLRWAAETYGNRLVVVTSFQPTGIITMHMLSEIAPETPVLTLDTGLLFPETYKLMDELGRRLNLNLTRIKPSMTVEEQVVQYGDALWSENPNKCCNLRKVMPLAKALVGYDAWISGLRRDQSRQRVTTPVITWDERHLCVKLSPFATWSDDMVWAYIHAHELPYNELHDRGYPSIGCWPCTAAVEGDTYTRSGRWVNRDKIECGIHLSPLGADNSEH
jgi:phosphoadenosine phosphosulfate reductase